MIRIAFFLGSIASIRALGYSSDLHLTRTGQVAPLTPQLPYEQTLLRRQRVSALEHTLQLGRLLHLQIGPGTGRHGSRGGKELAHRLP